MWMCVGLSIRGGVEKRRGLWGGVKGLVLAERVGTGRSRP